MPEIPQLEKLRDQQQALTAIAQAAWQKADNRNSQLLALKKKLQKSQEDNKTLQDNYKIVGTLSDVANGQTGKRVTIRCQRQCPLHPAGAAEGQVHVVHGGEVRARRIVAAHRLDERQLTLLIERVEG